MGGGTIKLAESPIGARTNHSIGVLSPASCGALRDKVANIERTIRAAEKRMDEELAHVEYMMRLNAGLFTANIVRDTCTAFLDLGASIAGMMGLKQVEATAKAGITAIDTVKLGGEVYMGQKSWGQAAIEGADLGAKHLPFGRMVPGGGNPADAAALAFATQKVTKTGKFGADLASAPSDEKSRATVRFLADSITSTSGLIQEGIKGPNPKGAGFLGAFNGAVGVVMAAENYDVNMTKAMDSYFEERGNLEVKAMEIRFRFKRKIAPFLAETDRLAKELEGCAPAG
ncbi:hypothetical protein GCM10011360_08780 [Primorskyibacter flagellatus]|uniref:Uncharacterized protein n=1 Tax=Primorskyibacter flagellatus TaxID=1387277 RepID=A0A917A2V3_9RHOB|nr:hypothetical protein [Primorskyibacter flagellatus]GGE22558.1 hypothetical protein GCM10011360_08780 [Primorskyibacter flagellatus]